VDTRTSPETGVAVEVLAAEAAEATEVIEVAKMVKVAEATGVARAVEAVEIAVTAEIATTMAGSKPSSLAGNAEFWNPRHKRFGLKIPLRDVVVTHFTVELL
jgi:hypothetical protein